MYLQMNGYATLEPRREQPEETEMLDQRANLCYSAKAEARELKQRQ